MVWAGVWVLSALLIVGKRAPGISYLKCYRILGSVIFNDMNVESEEFGVGSTGSDTEGVRRVSDKAYLHCPRHSRKVLKKLSTSGLLSFFETYSILSNTQYKFRKSRSTELALIHQK